MLFVLTLTKFADVVSSLFVLLKRKVWEAVPFQYEQVTGTSTVRMQVESGRPFFTHFLP